MAAASHTHTSCAPIQFPGAGLIPVEEAAMSVQGRSSWPRHVDQVIRSQHYSWLGEGLAGEPPAEALTEIITDIMHICRRQGIAWEALLARSQAQFETEENQVSRERGGSRIETELPA